ncbi:MAG: sugar ABC transporter ATP-binding protein [Phycisphaerae bacterium]|jgi:ABC-type sugar transport system ATPase subunit|nr:sugar ABC transporter ATP-binding protein [Phycisphaerae bacterium]
MTEDLLLKMTGICKNFPGVKALDNVDFSVQRGRVHALMGENGAGKSTLIKVLTGIYHKDAGEIIFDGKPIAPSDAAQSQHLGISTIYQELNLAPYLSVAENIFIGREPRRFGLIDWKTVRSRARSILSDMGVGGVDVAKPLEAHSVAIQQMVAIARALSVEARLLVMDEPTSSLSESEVGLLFDVIRRVQARGASVIFISHKMSEVFEICDTATILRDGCLVGEYPMADLTKLKMVSLMIGRDATGVLHKKKEISRGLDDRRVVLKASDLTRSQRTKEISIDIRTGQVLGVAGLLGSGRTELARILFGDTAPEDGEIEIVGKRAHLKSPRDAIKLGVGFCSEDRKAEGLFPHMSVMENMTIGVMGELSTGGVLSRKAQTRIAQTYIDKLNIKVSGPGQRMSELSGGNQQKVLLARWLCKKPILMILDEPMRGIDLGAKSEIEDIIADLAGNGVAVLMISSEMEELIRSCDTIVVLSEGRKVGQLTAAEISEERIMQMFAHGSHADPEAVNAQ